jgi:hypothetical protein
MVLRLCCMWSVARQWWDDWSICDGERIQGIDRVLNCVGCRLGSGGGAGLQSLAWVEE